MAMQWADCLVAHWVATKADTMVWRTVAVMVVWTAALRGCRWVVTLESHLVEHLVDWWVCQRVETTAAKWVV